MVLKPSKYLSKLGVMPDENGFYIIDDMVLTRKQMVGLYRPRFSRGRAAACHYTHKGKKWPKGKYSNGMI